MGYWAYAAWVLLSYLVAQPKLLVGLTWLELDLLRPTAALRWAELGLARSPDDAELQFLGGLALSRLGRHEEALTRLVAAVERDPRMRYGLPYLTAGESLLALGRWEEALDAFDRAVGINSSDLRGYLGRARAYHARGEHTECKKQIEEALSTYRCLPHHLRRQKRGTRLTAFWLRIRLMREPLAMLQAALLVGGLLVLAALATVFH
jgi:tetratricopeptide (TPR) repeat protein